MSVRGFAGLVTSEFFDILNYSICSAINDVVENAEVREIFRKMGKSHYQELKMRGLIKVPARGSPMRILEDIARYLESSGYMDRIVLTSMSESEAIVDMYGVSVLDSSVRLRSENREPSHIMTNTMFAALEEIGYSAEIIDLLFEAEHNHVREKWILKKL